MSLPAETLCSQAEQPVSRCTAGAIKSSRQVCIRTRIFLSDPYWSAFTAGATTAGA